MPSYWKKNSVLRHNRVILALAIAAYRQELCFQILMIRNIDNKYCWCGNYHIEYEVIGICVNGCKIELKGSLETVRIYRARICKLHNTVKLKTIYHLIGKKLYGRVEDFKITLIWQIGRFDAIHSKTETPTAITDHLLFWNRVVSLEDSTTLLSSNSGFHLKIKESLLIS